MGRPEISIVIPTRNRATLAQVAIQSALDCADLNLEVVVADNSDVSLDTPTDPRVIVLARPERAITMTENWERALRATRGEWITFMSDKHRLIPSVYRRTLELAKGSKLLFATFERACLFQELASDALTVDALWHERGTMLSPTSPETSEIRSARETMAEWHRIIRGAPHRPQIYRGIMHRSLVERVLQRSTAYFFGTCPDYASGLQIMSDIDHYIATNLPAVLVQIPTSDIGAWSPAQSLDEGGKLGLERMREVGRESFDRHHLPVTVTSSILETFLEFRRLRPDSCRDIRVDWQRYAWLASHEIESMKAVSSVERLRSHALVCWASQSDGVDLRPLSIQARVLVTRRNPKIAAGYLRLKRLLGVPDVPAPSPPWAWHRQPVGSLAQARVELAAAFGSRHRARS